jgi:hypothetical protein
MAYKRVSPQPVVEGGTGASTLTSNGVLLGNGTSAITATAVGTTGQVLTGVTGSAPTFQTPAAGGITTINGNTGSVTGSTVTVTTGASNADGTALFTGSSSTLTLSFTGASDNIGLGTNVLRATSGMNVGDVALGAFSLSSVSYASGGRNTAIGTGAGEVITTGGNNTLIGNFAGSALTTGSNNTAVGGFSSFNGALGQLLTGGQNLALGSSGGSNYMSSESNNIVLNSTGITGESNVLRIGQATGTGTAGINKCLICGITGITVTGVAVLVSSTNQLGVAVSSSQFKNDIQDMGSDSDALYKLRPVSFTWNKDSSPGLKDATDMRQYGLIAEEAVNVIPHAVNLDKDGKPFNINYHDLIGMLVNEVQRLSKRIDALESK